MITTCDCSTDCCKANDTTNHYHTEEYCFHTDGDIHKIGDKDGL